MVKCLGCGAAEFKLVEKVTQVFETPIDHEFLQEDDKELVCESTESLVVQCEECGHEMDYEIDDSDRLLEVRAIKE